MKKIFFLFFFFVVSISYSRHILGGNITYDCLGNNQYRFTMKVYKDCIDPNSPDFDRPAYFQIFNLDNNSLYDSPSLNPGSQRDILPGITTCIDNLPDFCTKEGTYTFTRSLPMNNSGYIISYQRCCRNNGVINLANSGSLGSAIFVKLTKEAMLACNKAPIFRFDPPNFVCVNSTLTINFSAADTEGDQLVYSLCAPYSAGDQNNPTPPTSGPITRLPFPAVNYNTGYSATQPLGLNSLISIDSLTGAISGIPKNIGLFTIGVCVKEYRNGVLLSETIRDFQINVQDCAVKEASPAPPNDPRLASVKINDSTYVVCNGKSLQFSNPGSANVTYLWDFGDPSTLADTSLLASPKYIYPDTGIYKVRLIIEQGKPCADTGFVYVKVYDAVNIKPSFSPACVGSAILFQDASSSAYNDINEWKWKFNNRDSALTQTTTYTYAAAGTYSFSFFVGTSKGCLVQKDTTVTILPKPKAGFNANYLCYNHNSTFTDASTISSGTIVGYQWNFGDGVTDSVRNPTHVYAIFDSFPVRHIVISALGCSDTIIKTIRMDDTVRRSFSTSPVALCEKNTITLTNTSVGGNPTAFQWIINNGSPINNQNAVSLPFNNAGTYPVQLISTNRCGNDTLNSSIKINPNPVIDLGATITVCNKSTKTLTAVGVFDSLRWHTNETTATVLTNGLNTPYSITVYKEGCVGRDTVSIERQVIQPDFSNTYLCLNKPIVFVNASSVNIGSLSSFDWDFGDGGSSLNTANPSHTFTGFNSYPIRLISTSSIGCKDTIIKILAMDSLLAVDFNTAVQISCQRRAVQFVDLTTGGFNNSNNWHLDGTSIAVKEANYTFSGSGNFPVKLVVSNRCYTDSLTKNITVRPRPNVFLGRDTILCKNQITTLSVNPSAYDSIRWINGSINGIVVVDGSINPYKIKVYLDGCDAEDTINITAQQFILDFSNTFLCYKSPITFLNTSTVNPGVISAYAWDFGDGVISTQNNPIHSYSTFGPRDITMIASSDAGCKDTLTKTIAMDDSIAFKVQPLPIDVCLKSTEYYLNQSQGGVNTNYIWSLNDDQLQIDSLAAFVFIDTGRQVIQLLANNRCGNDSVFYTFRSKPLPSISLADTIIICPGNIRTVFAGGDFDSVFWNTGAISNPIEIDGNIAPIIFKGYKDACFNTDTLGLVLDCELYIPTAFSPNNDDSNDFFGLLPINISTLSMRIFNRWGELIYETNDINKGWDGTYKGQPCQMDNYIYYATGIKKDNKSFSIKGSFLLLR